MNPTVVLVRGASAERLTPGRGAAGRARPICRPNEQEGVATMDPRDMTEMLGSHDPRDMIDELGPRNPRDMTDPLDERTSPGRGASWSGTFSGRERTTRSEGSS